MFITYPSPDGGPTRSILFDATPTEGHSSKVTITENEVESGAPVVDHVRPTPKGYTCEIVVSNTPITVPPDNMNGVTGSVREVDLGGGQKANVLQFSGEFDRARVVYEELVRVSDSGTLLSLTSSLRTYENLLLASIDVQRDVSKANALYAKLDFTQIRIVEVRSVPEPVIPQARPRTTRGNQTTQEDETAPTGSMLSRITGLGIRVRP